LNYLPDKVCLFTTENPWVFRPTETFTRFFSTGDKTKLFSDSHKDLYFNQNSHNLFRWPGRFTHTFGQGSLTGNTRFFNISRLNTSLGQQNPPGNPGVATHFTSYFGQFLNLPLQVAPHYHKNCGFLYFHRKKQFVPLSGGGHNFSLKGCSPRHILWGTTAEPFFPRFYYTVLYTIFAPGFQNNGGRCQLRHMRCGTQAAPLG